jgi:hypothetical protein
MRRKTIVNRRDSKTKAMFVLLRLKSKPIVDLCNGHRIMQNQYYLWRDQFLSITQKAFIKGEHRGKLILKEDDYFKQVVDVLQSSVENI